jgi:hypothetical protein
VIALWTVKELIMVLLASIRDREMGNTEETKWFYIMYYMFHAWWEWIKLAPPKLWPARVFYVARVAVIDKSS